MSREIKFRAWDVEGNQFWDDSLGDWKIEFRSGKEPTLIVLEETFSPFGEQEFYWRDVENTVFQQYTGLKDKNGKLIFEGDIVEERFTNPLTERDNIDRYKVEAADNSLIKMIHSSGKQQWDRFLWMRTQYVEVIGNIYESPELLEDSADE